MNSKYEMKEFFDACAPTWDEGCTRDRGKIDAIITMAQVTKGKKVLDIACGTGVLLPYLLAKNPGEIMEADLSDKMIEAAQKKCTDPRVGFFAGDIMDFHRGTYDVAIIYNAYPHFSDKLGLASHVCNLLGLGGRFIVAHSESKDVINSRHSSARVREISSELKWAREECKIWENFFDIDILVDTNSIYVFSGRKKA